MTYKRILLKLSGEALMGNEGYGIDPGTVEEVALQIRDVRDLGVEVAVVVGGGNIYRGMKAENQGIDRVTGDYMGMIATVLNALTLQEKLERLAIPARVQSALAIEKITEPYIRKKALKHLQNGKVVIFACGTGNPYFTTDTAAALRAVEMGADALLKATKVDGVFDKDPEVHKDAVFFRSISYMDVINKDLRVMDITAITLCKENDLPVVVFNLRGKNNMKKVVQGKRVGTIVRRQA
ncbi:MAG: Uridylate kinase [Syntrophorhabdus sp. PtaU1.Bin002]|nr:MAG: Uridylate kinase [Syntrophorhabdus sp. PtaB.Bin006]OPY63635.1 MAG: Uridylate kinase [Syntrophorhabdus sp. PtaU1.Bin002]